MGPKNSKNGARGDCEEVLCDPGENPEVKRKLSHEKYKKRAGKKLAKPERGMGGRGKRGKACSLKQEGFRRKGRGGSRRDLCEKWDPDK